MIDRGDIRQAIDRCSNIWASLPGAGYGQFEHKADSLIARNSKKRAERSEDWCMSRVTAIISALVICIIVCLSWAVNHCRNNAITYKAQRDKCQRTEAGERGNYWHADASAWCCCARCKIHEGELADAKAENDALRDDVAAGRRRLHIKAVCQSVREATTASGVDNAASRLADTAERDYFTLRELITMQKQLEGTQKYINEQCRWSCPYRWQLIQLLTEQYTRASSGV